jgi:hypothetical protein
MSPLRKEDQPGEDVGTPESGEHEQERESGKRAERGAGAVGEIKKGEIRWKMKSNTG